VMEFEAIVRSIELTWSDCFARLFLPICLATNGGAAFRGL
jgi:hypothetical protein